MNKNNVMVVETGLVPALFQSGETTTPPFGHPSFPRRGVEITRE